MKLREADQITTFIMTDDWHSINGEYDYAENGVNFVIEYVHDFKKVVVHGPGTPHTYNWKGTKDSMTQAFREWLHKTINEALTQ